MTWLGAPAGRGRSPVDLGTPSELSAWERDALEPDLGSGAKFGVRVSVLCEEEGEEGESWV